MQNNNNVSRRNFLQATGSLSGAAFLKLGAPVLTAITAAACTAERDSAPFLLLSADEAADFAAIAARIIPTTDTPGASEAGVIYFFDKAFSGAMHEQYAEARTGLADFNAALVAAGQASRFDQLSDADQDEFLIAQEQSDFFKQMWEMTIFGFFAMNNYGGNKDQVGWDLIGFEGHHGAWTYPFGYYDAEHEKEKSRGE